MIIGSTSRRVAAAMTALALALAACSSPSSPSPSSAAGASAPPASAQASAGKADAIPPTSAAVTLNGAGATFPKPLYDVWFQTYTDKYPNVKFNYQAIGSGGGITQITQQTVDFGASDAPMKDEELAKLPAGTKMLHIPTALGAVVVIFNVPGLTELKLDGDTVGKIFLGKISKWNDPAIAALNSGATLPDQAILVVHRSDGSGTTNAFTTYLNTASTDWKASGIGAGKDVKWAVGQGADKNDGVAAGVKNTPGAVGYVELQYATQAKLTSAKLKNADGNFVAGSTAGVTAAAKAAVAKFPADSRQGPIINGPGPDTYPIASYTYLLVYQDQKDKDKGTDLVSLIGWTLTQGQTMEEALGFVPLPAEVQQKAIAAAHTITFGGAPIWH
ncbi:MAG: phosphate ABC transporter substrate-binding protein PstS [Chloroflexota bacterium]|nr:phosphate ABC transporter substrate-binding protein PstS [Chloroflexota bacterium]